MGKRSHSCGHDTPVGRTPRRRRGESVGGTVSRAIFLDPSLVEVVLGMCVSLNDVKRLSGVSRATRRARWPFHSLSGHVPIKAMVARNALWLDASDLENGARRAEAPEFSPGAIAAMVDLLGSHRALAARGGLLRQLCPACAITLEKGLEAAAARAAFTLGYGCVRSANGWANAHAIVGACAHASLHALAFDGTPDGDGGQEDERGRPRAAGWGVREACLWALVQLLSVAKKRHDCRALVSQLRQLGCHTGCAQLLLAPAPRRHARRESLVAGYVGEAARELAAELLYLTSTGDGDYAAAVAACPLEALTAFACDFGEKSGERRDGDRSRHAAQFAVTHGLHLPAEVDGAAAARKLAFARAVVANARAAVGDASSGAKMGGWTAKRRDAVAACVESHHWFWGIPEFFKNPYRRHIELVSHDSWTVRIRSPSSRRLERESPKIRSGTLKLKVS